MSNRIRELNKEEKNMGLTEDRLPLIDFLIKSLGFDDDNVVRTSMDNLLMMGESAIEPLIRALSNENKRISLTSVKVLENIGKPAVEPLIKLLGSKNEQIMGSAMVILGNIGEPAVEPLIKMLSDGDDASRASAAIALKYVGEPAAEPLKKLMVNGDKITQGFASFVLEKLGYLEFAPTKQENINEPETFKGIKWGAHITEMAEMVQVKTSQGTPDSMKHYKRNTDKLVLGGSSLFSITYFFYKDIFCGAVFYYSNGDYSSIKNTLVSVYGKDNIVKDIDLATEGAFCQWEWTNVSIMLYWLATRDSGLGTCSLTFKPIFNEKEEDDASKAKQELL